ncbi:single-strand DNA-binding protein [Lacibacter cauensis]|uniref:Single-stranded DNA-binding protein n=1 Tax=Lacibacter cauensis TaxID=510947 RepID=A0A562SYH6_9BACT|nr:single-stranded DNA-binding protein [Lacibacter cauensis]TWI85766.1 single-strand DNA-binding protein [Lacibacter cauensis]
MEIIGRMTADASVNQTKTGKKVVNFSIAINDTYKAKESGELVKNVTYINCAYWLSAGIAPYLTKGTVVECAGRIAADTWTNKAGEVKARLTFTASRIKLHGGGLKPMMLTTSQPADAMTDAADDLPF